MPACCIVYEGRYRPAEMKVQSWLDRQAEKVARGLAVLEAAPPPIDRAAERRPDRARLRARLPRSAFRRRPGARIIRGCVAWHDKFAAQVPAFAATKVDGVNPRATNKSPGVALRGFAVFRQRRILEVVVQAGAHDVGLEFGIGADHR